jgi:hypothetical protein
VTYRTAKPGQVVYYSREVWQEREPVEFVRYYKDRASLTNPNMAVVKFGTLAMSVAIQNIYLKGN